MKLNKNILTYTSIAYLYIPIILFLFGWTKLWIALGCGLCLLYGSKKMCKDYTTQKEEPIKINYIVVAIGIILLIATGYFVGLGRWITQVHDWRKHNAVLKDLTLRSWPVYYKNGNEQSMLTYYIAQYLVPALSGKLFHSFRVTEIAYYVWVEIGLIIAWLNLVRVIKINNTFKQFASVIMFIFFSCPLWLAQIILDRFYNTHMVNDIHWFIKSDDLLLQYTSNFELFRWVSPQVITTWIILLLFIEHKEKIQHYITLMLPSMLFATLSFIGLLPLAIGQAFMILVRNRNFKNWIHKIFSLSNILSFISFGTVLILYFYGNIIEDKPDSVKLQRISYNNHIGIYFIFVSVMVLIYFACIWSDNKKNSLFYLAALTLIILPLFKLGKYNDLVMRCSIPSLFILMYMIIKFLNSNVNRQFFLSLNNIHKKFSVIVLCSLLLIGSHYPYNQFKEAIKNRHDPLIEKNYDSMEKFANRSSDCADDLKFNYYSYDIKNNLFYKFIAKKKIN